MKVSRQLFVLNPQVDSPLFAATIAAAAASLQLYQEDPVHQPLGLNLSQWYDSIRCCYSDIRKCDCVLTETHVTWTTSIVVYYTVTLSVEASSIGLWESLNCFAIFTQPPYSFAVCLVSDRLCLFT